MWGAALAAFEDLTFAARDDTNLRLGATHRVASAAPCPVVHAPETSFRRPGESLGHALWRHLNDLL